MREILFFGGDLPKILDIFFNIVYNSATDSITYPKGEHLTMKRTRLKKVLAVILAALTLLTATATLTALAVSAVSTTTATDYSVQNGTGTRVAVMASPSLSYRAKVQGEFSGFAFQMPTWGTAESDCTLALYKWVGNVRDSLAAEPIASKRFENLTDNATNRLDFEPQPAGEYLFAIVDVVGTTGVYANQNSENPKGFTYQGMLPHASEPVLTVTFTAPVDEPFGQCELTYDGVNTFPEEYVIPEDSLVYTHEVMPDTWVFTDGLGRTSLTNAEVGDPREGKTVAIFYWTWHNGRGNPINVNEIVEAYPEAINDYNHPIWPTSGYQSAWNEPIYGFYEPTDAWVTRRQSELLANAGIDAALADNTNWNNPNFAGCLPVMESWSDAMDDGVKTPKFSFMLPFSNDSLTAPHLRTLYTQMYSHGTFHKLWYYLDGKPMLMANGPSALVASNPLDKKISEFFTWRIGQPDYHGVIAGTGKWGWLSTYPQAYYYGTANDKKNKIIEQTTVGVAMNHNYVTHSLAAMNSENIMGRSYTSTYKNRYEVEGKEASKWGYNFAEQWSRALELDPKVIFITGWNEWLMGRYDSLWGTVNAFPDQFNDEFSRDIEPTKGDLKDHYYYQMVNFIRQYKGARPIPTPSIAATIDISKDNAQWSSVAPYYAAYIGNTDDRDSAGGMGDLVYSEYSGRNDIIGARVARDEENVYFYVECNEDITPYTDPLWMVLYIDSDQQNQGWETFDYVLNKTSPSAEKAVLERFTGNGYETETVGEVEYTVNGQYMQVKVPKSMLNLSGYDFTVNFAWTDNVHDEADKGENGDSDYVYTTFSGDIMDFYISGDVAPSGRFKYSFISTAANAGVVVEEPDTAPETDNVTEPVTEPTADKPSDEVTDKPADETTDATTAPETDAPDEKGCGSSLGFGIAAVTTAAAAAVALRKKDE